MAANNYFGFTHGGTTQYGAAATPAAYPAAGYAAAAATYTRPAGYDQQAYQAAAAATQGSYTSTPGTPAATYDYGYGRTAQTYDTSKTYYQQAGTAAGYTAPTAYDAAATAKVAGYSTAAATYAQPARPATATIQAPKVTQYNANQTYIQPTYSQTVAPVNTTVSKAAVSTNPTTTYSNYDAALYSAATMYVAQQSGKATTSGVAHNWQYKGQAAVGQVAAGHPQQQVQSAAAVAHPMPGGNPNKPRYKQQSKPQQLHYCEVCKISCAGPQTYREHLEGQKHKKREASLKLSSTAAGSSVGSRVNNMHCELCDVTCTGFDAFAAHVRGSKHQKVVKLHQKLGKPIPATDPLAQKKLMKINFVPSGHGDLKSATGEGTENGAAGATGQAGEAAAEEEVSQIHFPQDDIKPVGSEYIEEIKEEDGKIISFNCKLCECKFNDPNAKEMHMKGRRHRLQYKKKVQPDLVVDIKPSPRRQKIQEAKVQRAAMQEEYWNRRRGMPPPPEEMDEEERMLYWEERRRFEEEYDYMNWMQRGFTGPNHGPYMGGRFNHPFYGMIQDRRPESSDDRHVVAKHAEIYPKEEELQTIQRIVSHTERALKFVSDALTDPTDAVKDPNAAGTEAQGATNTSTAAKTAKEDGRDNQMFSFQKEAEGSSVRILKGVMRVGLLAKGLLLQGDNVVQLVVLCAEKPTQTLLKRVAAKLPVQWKNVSEEHSYTVSVAPEEGAVLVSDGQITVKVSLTSPILREQQQQDTMLTNPATTEQPVQSSEDLLPREPCLQALAALRHAKWFQARATGLQSCVMVMRVLRDLCQRTPAWNPVNQWAMELLTEKVISSAGIPLSPGDCVRRVMEAVASGIFNWGPGVMDPCEKEPTDALGSLTKQQREDLTVSGQQFLRLIAFRQIHKVLAMEPLPQQKFQQRPWRYNRKRRRSGTESAENESDAGDGNKLLKKEVASAEGGGETAADQNAAMQVAH